MTAPVTEKDLTAELRLRGDTPQVMRLSRKALMALGATACVGVAGAVGWAMADHGRKVSAPELIGTDSKSVPENMAALPKDYAGVPKLGPPLPGDLGRPILATQAAGADMPTPPIGPATASPATDPALQAAQQERDSARTSHLFAADTHAAGSGAGATAAPSGAESTAASTGAPAGQPDHREAFLAAAPDTRTVSIERLAAPASPYIVQAGTVIPAALVTGVRSDLPGQVIGQVTENVYDSPTGRFLLIPQGSRLIGTYDSQILFGQSRVLLAWTRLILPGGRSIVLERQPAADAQGFAGLQDGVDRHWRQLFGAALLSTTMGVGAELGANQSDTDIIAAFRAGAANNLNQVGQQVVDKQLDVAPTLTIRPGHPVRVMVTRDLVLEPINR